MASLLTSLLRKDRYTWQKKLAKAPTDAQVIADIQTLSDTAQQRWNSRPTLIYPSTLPIMACKDTLVQAIQQHSIIIVAADTGSGKSTQLAKFCLEAGLGRFGTIACVQPRRLGAISIAQRIAYELEQPLGQSVGYRIRFDDHSSPHALIRLMTDGLLLAQLQRDPLLLEYDAIIVDEAHERSLNIDLLIGMLSLISRKRPDLKIIISSATLDTDKFCQALQAPLFVAQGRMYPVAVHYRPAVDNQDLQQQAVDVLTEILHTSRQGDVLIFMPTEEDIHQTIALAQKISTKEQLLFLPLFARLSQSEQKAIFQPFQGRKIIVATNIAETTLTIDGIVFVIDSGLARLSQYSSQTRLQSLPIVPISQASSNQRKGRCGRVQDGVCYRLYSEEDFESRPAFTLPEIQRSNLAETVLRMLALRIHQLEQFPFLDAPSKRSFYEACQTLHELGAIASPQARQLTPIGQKLAHFPLDPRLTRILLAAHDEGCLNEAIVVVCGLSSQEIRERPQAKAATADQKHALFYHSHSDFLFFWLLYQHIMPIVKTSKGALRRFCQEHFLSYRRVQEWLQLIEQITKILKDKGYRPSTQSEHGYLVDDKKHHFATGYMALHKALLTGYFRQVFRTKEVIKDKRKTFQYLTLDGKDCRIFPGSRLHKLSSPWAVSATMVRTSQLFLRMNAVIDVAWLVPIVQPFMIYKGENPYFRHDKGEVMCHEKGYFSGILLDEGREVPLVKYNTELAYQIFLQETLLNENAPAEWQERYPFWQHNEKIKATILSAEDKIRKRQLYAGDQALLQFYQKHLPPIASFIALDLFIQQHGDTSLCVQESDLLAGDMSPYLAGFPDQYQADTETVLPLHYQFSPGHSQDGFSLVLRPHEIKTILQNPPDWVPPGLLLEKIDTLLRALPKEHRLKLHPLGASGQTLAQHIQPQQALCPQLCDLCRTLLHVAIPLAIWQDTERQLPHYLRLQYTVQDSQGHEILSTRDIQELALVQSSGLDQKIMQQEQHQFEQDHITSWPMAMIPEEKQVYHSGQQLGILYPALTVINDDIALRLFESKNESETQHKQAIGYWLTKRYAKEWQGIKNSLKSTAIPQALAYFGGDKGMKQLFWTGFEQRYLQHNIRTEADWQMWNSDQVAQTAHMVHQDFGYIQQALNVYSQLRDMMAKMLQTMPTQRSYWQQQRDQLEIWLHPIAWGMYSRDMIKLLPSYLHAMHQRYQRATNNIAKDLQKGQDWHTLASDVYKIWQTAQTGHSLWSYQSMAVLVWQWHIKLYTPELAQGIKISLGDVKEAIDACQH